MTITDTVLVFVGIPAAIVASVYGLVYASSAARTKRYRPGRPFNQSAVWFVANKSGTPAAAGSGHELGAGTAPHALPVGTPAHSADDATHASEGGAHAAAEHGSADRKSTESGEHGDAAGLATVGYGETGGASDSW